MCNRFSNMYEQEETKTQISIKLIVKDRYHQYPTNQYIVIYWFCVETSTDC